MNQGCASPAVTGAGYSERHSGTLPSQQSHPSSPCTVAQRNPAVLFGTPCSRLSCDSPELFTAASDPMKVGAKRCFTIVPTLKEYNQHPKAIRLSVSFTYPPDFHGYYHIYVVYAIYTIYYIPIWWWFGTNASAEIDFIFILLKTMLYYPIPSHIQSNQSNVI